jgi:hypothetical protein
MSLEMQELVETYHWGKTLYETYHNYVQILCM